MRKSDNLHMAKTKKSKSKAKHRPNGLIAEFRAAAPERNTKFIEEASKEAKRSVREAAKLGKSIVSSLSTKTINKILASG